ncbi:hypothetical protein LQW54_009631 [Pestalotiopsis sp. IQ-011]
MKLTLAASLWLVAQPLVIAASALPGSAALEKRACLPALNYTVEIEYVGCYTDPTTPRTLTGASFTLSSNSPENCGFLCGRAGYSYAGVEYTSQCFCGNSIGNEQADESSCSSPCPGDAPATCGQAYFVNVWEVTNPVDGGVSTYFPDRTRDPLCSNAVCDTSLSTQERASALVANLTIDEKLANLVEEAPGVPRLGIMPYATSFPQPILTGAAFDDELVKAIGEVISTETRAYDNVGRVGLDLYDFSSLDRITSIAYPDSIRHQTSTHSETLAGAVVKRRLVKTLPFPCSEITLQDLSEYYLPPFKTCAADKQVGAIMCSYNAVNGNPACADTYLLEDILRQHWGWESPEHYVSSDCGAIDDISGGHAYASDLGHALTKTTDWLSTLNLPVLELPLSVENTGNATSGFVVLLFANSTAGPTTRPSKILAAYGRVKGVEPGATASTSLEITLDRLTRVDEQGNRVLYPGTFELFVGLDAKANYQFTWTGSDLTIENFPQPSATSQKRSR